MWLKGRQTVRMMETLNRKYDDTDNELGFAANEDANAPNPWCVVCGEELANEVIRPSPTNHHHHHYHRHGGFLFRPICQQDYAKTTEKNHAYFDGWYVRVGTI